MNDVARQVQLHLNLLKGFDLFDGGRAADMRMFDFIAIPPTAQHAVVKYALHVQCPWRIETADRILTGRHDLFSPAEETSDFDWGSWHYDGNETLQDRLMAEFTGKTPRVVEEVFADAHGGARIHLSGGYALVLFPTGSDSEDWRLFRAESEGNHFVICGGRIE